MAKQKTEIFIVQMSGTQGEVKPIKINVPYGKRVKKINVSIVRA